MKPREPQIASSMHPLSPLTPSKAGWERVMLIALVLTAFCMPMRPLDSFDVWHHIASGRLVAQNGGPAHTDPFSCTAHGKTWIQFEWLSQLIIYELYSLGGVNALYFFQAVMIAMTAAFLVAAARKPDGSSLPASVAAVILAMMAASIRFTGRPESFTFLAFAIFMFAGEEVRRTGQRFWLPALIIIPWVNMHGAWIAGFAWLGLIAAGETSEKLFRPALAKSTTVIRRMWIALGLALAATLLNPYGWRIWEVPFSLNGAGAIRQYVSEWRQPSLDYWLDPRSVGIYVFLAAVLAAWRQLRISDWFVLILSGYLLQSAVRHVAIAMLMAVPSAAAALQGACELVVSQKPLRFVAKWKHAIVVVLCIGALLVTMGGLSLPLAGMGFEPNMVPEAAAEYLARNNIDGNLFNTYAYGNYLLFARYPQNRVFIDGRVDMYGAEILKQFGEVSLAKTGWEDTLRHYKVECMVLALNQNTEKPLLAALPASKEWALVYWDDISAVYLRRDGRYADFVKNAYVYSIRPDSIDSFEQDPASIPKAAADFRHKLAEDPSCAAAAYGLALCLEAEDRVPEAMAVLCDTIALRPKAFMLYMGAATMLLDAGKYNEAIMYYEGALQNGAPRRPAYSSMAIAYDKLGRVEEAVAYARRAVKAAPDNPYMRMNLSMLLEESGDLSGALDAARAAAQIDPRDPDFAERVNMLEAKTAGRTR